MAPALGVGQLAAVGVTTSAKPFVTFNQGADCREEEQHQLSVEGITFQRLIAGTAAKAGFVEHKLLTANAQLNRAVESATAWRVA